MGEMAQKISKVDHKELLDILNVAFAEEWLAYYQYWIAARIMSGPMSLSIGEEFKKHAHEEKEHAELLATRIIELGGTPLIDPNDWSKVAKCKYDAPTDEYVLTIVKQVLAAERCAVTRYQQICDRCFGKDYQTFKISAHILEQELDHEQDMEDYITDISEAMAHAKN